MCSKAARGTPSHTLPPERRGAPCTRRPSTPVSRISICATPPSLVLSSSSSSSASPLRARTRIARLPVRHLLRGASGRWHGSPSALSLFSYLSCSLSLLSRCCRPLAIRNARLVHPHGTIHEPIAGAWKNAFQTWLRPVGCWVAVLAWAVSTTVAASPSPPRAVTAAAAWRSTAAAEAWRSTAAAAPPPPQPPLQHAAAARPQPSPPPQHRNAAAAARRRRRSKRQS